MSQANAILGLLAESSLHAGTGQLLGAVDLPIEREAHTGWPCVYGSGVKGALRALAYHSDLGELVDEVFGPDVGNASDHAGAVAVSDARLLLLPVRSLDAAFRWITCPAILERLARDLRRAGVSEAGFAIPTVPDNTAVIDRSTPEGQEGREGVFLEELRVEVERADLQPIIEVVKPLIGDETAAGHLAERLALVNDIVFGDLVRSAAIPVTAHVKLKYETKTVDGGALRYQESLPPDTVLYTLLSAFKSRKEKSELQAQEVLETITEKLFGERPYLQLGGNETVGMGWCKVAAVAGGVS